MPRPRKKRKATPKNIVMHAVRVLLRRVRDKLDMTAEEFCDHTVDVDPEGGWSFFTYRKWEGAEREMTLSSLREFAEYAGADSLDVVLDLGRERISVRVWDVNGGEMEQ